MPRLSNVLAVLVALLALNAYRQRRTIRAALSRIDLPPVNHGSGECTIFRNDSSPNIPLKYCEDLLLWDAPRSPQTAEGNKRRVILSCDPGRKSWNTVMGPLRDPKPRGHLWVYDPNLNPPIAYPLELTNFPEDAYFHPLGMDVYTPTDGSPSILVVINHSAKFSTLERFTLSLSPSSGIAEANHLDTFSSIYVRSPNAIAMTGPNSFYVTNDHFFTRRLPFPLGEILPLFETLMGLSFGWVNHVTLPPPLPQLQDEAENNFKSKHRTLTLQHHLSFPLLFVPFPNGISLSRTTGELAIASSSRASVYIYTHHPLTYALTYLETIEVPFGVDNLAYDDQGVLVVAGHPDFPALSKIARGWKDVLSPSWVISLAKREKAHLMLGQVEKHGEDGMLGRAAILPTYSVSNIFQSDGSFFHSATAGVVDSRTRTAFITGLYQEGLLICQSF